MSSTEADSFDGFQELDEISVAGFNQTQLDGCYWNGSKQFESALALAIFRSKHETESIAGFDNCLQELSSAFPYKSQLELFRQKLSFAVSAEIELICASPRQSYLTVVGVLTVRGLTEDRRLFTQQLQKQVSEMLKDPLLKSETRVHPHADLKFNVPPRSRPAAGTSEDDADETTLRLASNALYQHGLRSGFHPAYKEEPCSDGPGQHAQVTCDDMSFEAVARNKKKAKQLAAVKACKAFGVVIR